VRNRRLSVLMLMILALAFSVLPTSPPVQAMQVQNSLELTVWPTYLGPEVVISGHVSSSAGVPTVTVTVVDVAAPAVPIFSGTASSALRPPLGDPAASWRVPLTLADGTYQVTAVSSLAPDTLTQEVAEFQVVSQAVAPLNLIPLNGDWAYYDMGDEPTPSDDAGPVLWHDPDYDASTWQVGPAEFGYGDDDEATLTQEFAPSGDRVITQYFRHEFVAPDLADFDQITMNLLRDDGAVVYLNGTELGRTNMPGGLVDYSTFAVDNSEQTITITFDAIDLVPGTNLIAVEVHQRSEASSDLSFDMTLEAIQSDAPKVSNNTEGTFVLAAGDMARCNFDGDEAVADQMADLFDTDRGLFIGLGDLVYNSGTIDEFTACYDPTIGQFRDVTWPAPGNHEHYTTPNAAGYRQYFGPAAGPTAGPAGGLWYSFDIDEYWHVIALDSDCSGVEVLPGAVGGDGCAVGSEQEQWLRADLEANQDKNILAFFHHPPYTNNHYTDHEYTWPLWRALSEYGAEITLHGHEHHYERYVPLDYWGEPSATNAINEFIIGSGGTYPRYTVRPQAPESAFRGTFPNGTNDFGVLQLWLQPNGYEWKWESIYGLAATDQGTGGLNDPMDRGLISGVVSNEFTAAPLVGFQVCATAQRTQLRECTITDAQGNYTLAQPVVIDDYQIVVTDPADELVQSAEATVALVAGANAADVTMVPPPSISGKVTQDPFGFPVSTGQVCVEDMRAGEVPFGPVCAATASNGTYEVGDLELNRSYEVTFTAPDFVGECYDEAPLECAGATRVDVGIANVNGIDAAIRKLGGQITGQVTNASTRTPLSGIVVCASSSSLAQPRCVLTAADGNFVIDDLGTSNYTVSYEDPAGLFESECYRNKSCDRATAVGVTQPNVRTNIDASLNLASDPPPQILGDADCSGNYSVADALLIAQFAVGTRVEASCPRTDTSTQIAVGSADVNSDGLANVTDAVLVAQCVATVNNILCP